MWNYLIDKCNGSVSVNMTESFYVGDAAGRPKDWAPGKKVGTFSFFIVLLIKTVR